VHFCDVCQGHMFKLSHNDIQVDEHTQQHTGWVRPAKKGTLNNGAESSFGILQGSYSNPEIDRKVESLEIRGRYHLYYPRNTFLETPAWKDFSIFFGGHYILHTVYTVAQSPSKTFTHCYHLGRHSAYSGPARS